MANHAAIEQEYRDFQAVLARQGGIGIHIQNLGGGDLSGSLQPGESLEHLLAEMTALAAEHHQTAGKAHEVLFRRLLAAGRRDAQGFGRRLGGRGDRKSVV